MAPIHWLMIFWRRPKICFFSVLLASMLVGLLVVPRLFPNSLKAHSERELSMQEVQRNEIVPERQHDPPSDVHQLQNSKLRPTTPQDDRLKGSKSGQRKQYVIYLCNDKKYCYGLGDRQRGIVSVYLLAVLTNRTFGIIMTSPSNFTEFYKPRLVDWDIPSSELEGKTFIEEDALGGNFGLRLNDSDFNANHPQDVVYIRTNQKFHFSLIKNPFYKDRFPKWAQVPHWKLYQDGWMRLMMPTAGLRRDLNDMLIRIVGVMEEEQRAWHTVKQTGCCDTVSSSTTKRCVQVSCSDVTRDTCCAKNISGPSNSTKMNCSNGTCLGQQKTNCLNSTGCLSNCTNGTNCLSNCTNGTNCLSNCTNGTNCLSNCTNGTKCMQYCNENCSEKNYPNEFPYSDVDTRCADKLKGHFKNSSEVTQVLPMVNMMCRSPPIPHIFATVENIQQSKDYDLQDMNLVCAHVRLGWSKTMPFETNVRNKVGAEKAVWEFLKPYVAKGHHIYLATDSEQVREEAKRLFGYRLHVSSIPIVHIASVQKGQDKRQGFGLTLMEQLLLSTSCSVLMVSYSGFSMKAAQIRHVLRPEADSLFIYRAGEVVPVKIHSLL